MSLGWEESGYACDRPAHGNGRTALGDTSNDPLTGRNEPHMPQTERLALVLNPVKRHSDRAREAVARAAAAVYLPEPAVYETTPEDPGADAARQALLDGATRVVVAGGDGTVRAVAGQVAHSGASLGILPLGTGNLLARNLGVDIDDLDAAARAAVHGDVERIDAMAVTAVHPGSEDTQHVALVAVGVGLDAQIMASTNEKLKLVVGPLAYAWTAAGRMLGRRYPVRLSVDAGAWSTWHVRTSLVANAGYIQGGIEFAPGALLDDGRLNLVVIQPRSLVGWFAVALKTLWRPSSRLPVVEYREGTLFRLRPVRPLPAQVDGDPIGEVTTLQVRVLPGALPMRVPGAGARQDPADRAPHVRAFAQLTELTELPPVQRVKRRWRRALGQLLHR